MRFVNDDVKLKKGGRRAVKITQNELNERIIARAKHLMDKEELLDYEEYCDESDDEGTLIIAIRTLLREDSIIKKDMKYIFDSEDIEVLQSENNAIIGFFTFENGLTILGTLMEGWGSPVSVIFYYDGKNIRGYIPTYGNNINVDFKTSFLMEQESPNYDTIVSKYKESGLINKNEKEFDVSEIYLRKYGISLEEFNEDNINWNAVKEDIITRIEIV